jgi:hypothetical protein
MKLYSTNTLSYIHPSYPSLWQEHIPRRGRVSQIEYDKLKEENEQLRQKAADNERWKQMIENTLDKLESNAFAQKVQIMESVRATVQAYANKVIQASTTIVQQSTAAVIQASHQQAAASSSADLDGA